MHIDHSSPKKRCFLVEMLKSRRWKPTRLGLSALDPVIKGVITDTNTVIMNSAFMSDSELSALERMTQHLVLTLSSVTNINDTHAEEYIQGAARFHTKVLMMSSKVAARQLPVARKTDNEEPNFPAQRSEPNLAPAGLCTEGNIQDNDYASLRYCEAYLKEAEESENDCEEHIPWARPTTSSIYLTIPAVDLPAGRNAQHPSPRCSPMDLGPQPPSKMHAIPQRPVDLINVFAIHSDRLEVPDPESTMIATTVLPLTEGNPTPVKADRVLDGGKFEASAEPSRPISTFVPAKGPSISPLGSQPEPSAHLSVLDMNSLPTIRPPFNDNTTVHYQDPSSNRRDRSEGYRRRLHISASTAAVATASASAIPSNHLSTCDYQSSMPSHQFQGSSKAQVPPPTPLPGLTRTRYTSVPSKPPAPTRSGDTDTRIRRASFGRAASPGVPRTDLTSTPRSVHIYTASTPSPITPIDHHPSECLLSPSGMPDNSASTREGGGSKQHRTQLDAEFSGGLDIHHRQRAGACEARNRRSVSLSARRRRRQSTSSSTSGMHIEIEYYRFKVPIKEAMVRDDHICAHVILEKVDPRNNTSGSH